MRIAHRVKGILLGCCLIGLLVAVIASCASLEKISASLSEDAERQDAAQQGKTYFPTIDWDRWMQTNPDVIGWLTVPGTTIDCPIVQARCDDPEYYLSHNIYRNNDEKGCAFLDAECEECGLLSRNSVVFGHHLAKGRGFSPIAEFAEEGFAKTHRTIFLQTPFWQKTLKVLAAEVTRGDAPTKVTDFESSDQFTLWLSERYSKSAVKLEDDPRICQPERVWTFCTCSYSTYANERTLVYAIE